MSEHVTTARTRRDSSIRNLALTVLPPAPRPRAASDGPLRAAIGRRETARASGRAPKRGV